MAAPHPVIIELAAGRTAKFVEPGEAPALLASALEHGMHGLLWSSVSAGEIHLPRDQALILAKVDLAVRAHNAQLWAMLTDLQERLGQIGVRVATAKGISAEARWYDRPGERPSNDLDLLLEPGSEVRIEEVIDLLEPEYFLRDDAPELVRHGILQSLDMTVDGVEVDLHTDLLKIEIPTRGAQTIWARTIETMSPDGVSVRTTDAEISLIHFLVHLHKDRFARLLGYADVSRILQKENLDWAFIDAFLATEGLRVHAYGALHRVASVLDLEPPPVPSPKGWRGRAWARLWPAEQQLLGRPGFAFRLEHQHFWIPWLAEGRAMDALRWWIRRRVFPPRTLVELYYPDTRGPYLLRLISGRRRRARERRAARDRFR
jgi:hypothetical protein